MTKQLLAGGPKQALSHPTNTASFPALSESLNPRHLASRSKGETFRAKRLRGLQRVRGAQRPSVGPD
jgi:hypothetical protein